MRLFFTMALLGACGGKDAALDTEDSGAHTGGPNESLVLDVSDCYPGALEHCNNHDDDCDGRVDEWAVDMGGWFNDVDGDGYGNPGVSFAGCNKPGATWVLNGDDCDDDWAEVHPGADEVCDNLRDDDCDGLVDDDDDDVVLNRWYNDVDGDGWGGGEPVEVCEAPAGLVRQGGDCDDEDGTVHPFAAEVTDGLDNDCDDVVDEGAL